MTAGFERRVREHIQTLTTDQATQALHDLLNKLQMPADLDLSTPPDPQWTPATSWKGITADPPCHSRPDDWFPQGGSAVKARFQCRPCPPDWRRHCLLWAVYANEQGIWGGSNQQDRIRLRLLNRHIQRGHLEQEDT